jgi:hypothetical protein
MFATLSVHRETRIHATSNPSSGHRPVGLTLIGLGAANAQASYHTPSYDYYQNNWLAGG